jgi:VanZ family protein
MRVAVLKKRLRPICLIAGWGWAAAIVWLSLTPSPPKLDFEQGDKLGHFVSYGALMFLFCMVYRNRNARLLHAAVFVLMGVALEFIQGWLGYRTYDPFDMLANTVGVALGWMAALVIRIPR